jgi:Tol biopolymer transport system component
MTGILVLLGGVAPAVSQESAEDTPWFRRQKIRFGWGQWHRHYSEGFDVDEVMENISRAGVTVYVDRWSHGVKFAHAAKRQGLRYLGELSVATASFKPGGVAGRPAVSMLGQTHYQAREAGMKIHAPPKTLVPCPLDGSILHEWFTKPCLDMVKSGSVDGCHIDYESYGFTAFDKLGEYLCYCDECFRKFLDRKGLENKVEPAKRYGWLQDRGWRREYLVNLRERIAAIYRAEAEKIWSQKPDFIFSAYPDFSPGELETSWRTEGVARGLHRPQTPFILVDASNYWPNHRSPWWDTSRNAVHKLGMLHVLGTWTASMFGLYPTLDVSAEQWLYETAASHDGHWVWFEHVWGPNDLRVQRAAHRRISALESRIGDLMLRGEESRTFATVVEQSGNPALDEYIRATAYSIGDRHAVRVSNAHTDLPAEVRVRMPRLPTEGRWRVGDVIADLHYTTAEDNLEWTAVDLTEGVWLSMEKRSDVWLLLEPTSSEKLTPPSTTISGGRLKGHKPRPKTDDATPGGAAVDGKFQIVYTKTNPLEYHGGSGPSVTPVRGSSIHWVDAATGNERKLFGIDANCWSPALSPDGSLVAFSCYVNGQGQIYVMNADGSNVVNVSRNDHCDRTPVWSPDGDRIAFVSDRDSDWDIYVMKRDGSDVRVLADSPNIDRRPAWSPDGRTVAYESDRGGDFDIFLVDADGGNDRTLLSRSRNEYEPVWSPDGRSVACTVGMFGKNRDVMIVHIDDGSVEHPLGLTRTASTWWPFDNITDICWSPDGTRIAGCYEKRLETGVFVVNVDGTDLRTLVAADPLKTYPGGDVPRYKVVGGWFVNGSASRRWLLYSFQQPHWSPDGGSLAFRTDMDPSGYFFFHTIPAEGGDARRLDATLDPTGPQNKPVPLRGESSAAKPTSGFAKSPPEQGRYYDGSSYERMMSRLTELSLLPVDGWAFKSGGLSEAELKRLTGAALVDSELPSLRIDKFWDDQGYPKLTEGWYRKDWTCPELPEGKRAFLHVGAVDESLWVYIDGRLTAWYDADQPGQTWDKPLLLEVSGNIVSGREHVIVLRVTNTALAGGVWKPIGLMVEK